MTRTVKSGTKPSPRAPRAEGPLDRRRIVEAALAQIDAHGLEALSMRRLGASLGVEGMALYHHFRSKAELLDAVMDLLLDEPEAPLLAPGTAWQRLRRTMEEMRAVALRHPHGFLMLATRRFRTPRSLQFYERLLGEFRAAGFAPADCARWFRVLGGFVIGAGLAEIGSRAQHPDASPVILEDFADARFPNVTAAVPHLRVARLGSVFKFGLDTLFEAMERAAKTR